MREDELQPPPVSGRESPESRGPALTEATWLSAGHYFGQLIFLLRGLFLASLLGPFYFGLWTSMRMIRDLGRYLSLGATEGMEQMAPWAQVALGPAAADRLRSAAAGVALGVATVTAVAIATVALLPSKVGGSGDDIAWVVFAGVFVLAQYYFFNLAALRTYHSFRTVAVITATVTTVSLLGLLVIPRWGLVGFLVVLGAVYGLGISIAARSTARFVPRADPATAAKLIAHGFPIMSANLLSSLQWSLDKIFVLGALSVSELGVYALSTPLINAVMVFPRNVAAVMYPRLRERQAVTETLGDERAELERLTSFLGQLVTPTLGLLWIALEYLVLLALPTYAGAVAPGRVLLLGVYLPVLAGLTTPVLLSHGGQRPLIGSRLLGLLVTGLGLLFVQAKGPDLVLVAGATAIGLMVQSSAALFATLRVLEIGWREALTFAARAGVGLVGLAVLLLGLVGLHPTATWQELSRGQVLVDSLLATGLLIWLLLALRRGIANRRFRSAEVHD